LTDPSQARLRQIPKVDALLAEPRLRELVQQVGREPVVAAIREVTGRLRLEIQAGSAPEDNDALLPHLCERVAAHVATAERRTLRRAINATGVVLHTGLGRAVLSDAAAEAVSEAARSHSLLEIDPETGERGSRLDHVRGLLRELTGAPDAVVVNNNAAAVFLAISAMAVGREVIISRGQLVEIGGSFRIPDVIRSAGARLVEVGTTNKVRLRDYAAAITPETALILRVHPSNFRIVGFTEEPSLAELIGLGRERGIPVMDDLGSGALVDLTPYGLRAEPMIQAAVGEGADLVTFSGDKLLGGPQAGFVLGSEERIRQLRSHPLMRVLRLDKLTLAALQATLRLYRSQEVAFREIPTLAALSTSAEALQKQAEALARTLEGLPLEVRLEQGASQVGGGALPGEDLPTTLVAVRSAELEAGELARRLRLGEPSVWGRVRKGWLLLDPRTVTPPEQQEISGALRLALTES
jgi:L-seryl-tRNA(Ser) seleniumtransferase